MVCGGDHRRRGDGRARAGAGRRRTTSGTTRLVRQWACPGMDRFTHVVRRRPGRRCDGRIRPAGEWPARSTMAGDAHHRRRRRGLVGVADDLPVRSAVLGAARASRRARHHPRPRAAAATAVGGGGRDRLVARAHATRGVVRDDVLVGGALAGRARRPSALVGPSGGRGPLRVGARGGRRPVGGRPRRDRVPRRNRGREMGCRLAALLATGARLRRGADTVGRADVGAAAQLDLGAVDLALRRDRELQGRAARRSGGRRVGCNAGTCSAAPRCCGATSWSSPRSS